MKFFKNLRKIFTSLGSLSLVLIGVLFFQNASASTTGTWTLYPPQSTVYTTQVRPPVNANGTSSWPYKRGTIPIQFNLLSGAGPVIFQSIFSDNPGTTGDDYSYLSFAPNPALTFNQITDLHATYAFTTGNCGGGALRWSVTVDKGGGNYGSVFIYYGALPNFTECIADTQSGENMIGMSDMRYDTSQVGGTFYDTYSHAQTLVGSLPVVEVSLVLDGGWTSAGDQKATISNVGVNDNTFVPMNQTLTRTCNLPPAKVSVTRLPGLPLPVNQTVSTQPGDNTGYFRNVDCKYIYNLEILPLPGAGVYNINAVINNNSISAPATFGLK